MSSPPVSPRSSFSVPKPLTDTYQAFTQGRLGFSTVTVFLKDKLTQIKEHDDQIFPVVLGAIAVTLLAVSFVSSLIFFTLGALYAVWKGNEWLEWPLKHMTTLWESSKLGKVAVLAGAFFLIPFRCEIAAFGLGIYVVTLLQKGTEKPLNKNEPIT